MHDRVPFFQTVKSRPYLMIEVLSQQIFLLVDNIDDLRDLCIF